MVSGLPDLTLSMMAIKHALAVLWLQVLEALLPEADSRVMKIVRIWVMTSLLTWAIQQGGGGSLGCIPIFFQGGWGQTWDMKKKRDGGGPESVS